jgi:hypothetical protein
LPPEVVEVLEEKYPTATAEYHAAWDVMAVAFRGEGETDVLRFLYHYPSSAEAEQDVKLVRTALTEMPSLRSSGRVETWGDYLTLESITVEDSVLIAQATTTRKRLILTTLMSRDYTFVPLRPGSPP